MRLSHSFSSAALMAAGFLLLPITGQAHDGHGRGGAARPHQWHQHGGANYWNNAVPGIYGDGAAIDPNYNPFPEDPGDPLENSPTYKNWGPSYDDGAL